MGFRLDVGQLVGIYVVTFKQQELYNYWSTYSMLGKVD